MKKALVLLIAVLFPASVFAQNITLTPGVVPNITPTNVNTTATTDFSQDATPEDNSGKVVYDENGCAVSAGYVWSYETNTCLRTYSPENVFKWAKTHGLTQAKNLAEFRPYDTLTRSEAVLIVKRAFDEGLFIPFDNEEIEANYFADTKRLPTETIEAINFAQTHGIVRGNNGRFSPNGKLTLIDTARILARSLDSSRAETEFGALYFLQEDLGRFFGVSDMHTPASRFVFFSLVMSASELELEGYYKLD